MWLNCLTANLVGMEFKLSWERNIHRRVFTLSIKLEWSKTVTCLLCRKLSSLDVVLMHLPMSH